MVCEKTNKWIGQMVKSKRKRSSKTLRNFFLNDELHRTLVVNRAEDILIAWNYSQGKRVAYVLSDARLTMQRAYSIQDVANIFNRQRKSILRYIADGNIPAPQKSYPIGDSSYRGKYFMNDKDIFGLHDYLLTVNRGRPRNDGEHRATDAPSRKELEAILNNDTILYVKGKDGQFSPVWKQPEW